MHPFSLARRFFGRAFGSFKRADAGATAVEFGLVALPFLALAGASLEAGVTYLSQEILQDAVTEASRQIYTGQFQTNNAASANSATLLGNFRAAICNPNGQRRMTPFTCDNIRVSITKAASFGQATPTTPTVTNPTTGVSDWNPNFSSYTCARASDVIVVQAVIDLPVYFTMLNAAAASLPNDRRILQASAVFQVEPYNSTAACPSGS